MSDGKSIASNRDPGGASDRGDADAVAVTAMARTIARSGPGTAMTTVELETQRLIHEDLLDPHPTDTFRELRTRLLLSTEIRSPVILVSGVSAGCGSSFVARNLAAAIALEEDRTALLIDCNPRRPSLERTFAVESGPGLWDYLRSPQVHADQIIYATGVERLDVIPTGRIPRGGGDHLASLRMHALVVGLTGRFPHCCLIFDAPPAIGSPEARMLAERADLIILVAGAGLHGPEAITQASRVFDPEKLAGVVFNELP